MFLQLFFLGGAESYQRQFSLAYTGEGSKGLSLGILDKQNFPMNIPRKLRNGLSTKYSPFDSPCLLNQLKFFIQVPWGITF